MRFKKTLSQTLLLLSMQPVFLNSVGLAANNTQHQIWGSVEYLNWWIQDSPIGVPLITENNNPNAFAMINEPGTNILFGAGSHHNSFTLANIGGGRITIGGWLDTSHCYGIEASAFGLSRKKKNFTASSVNGQIPALNIPFFSTNTSSENVLVEKHPNTATVNETIQPFNLEINGIYHMPQQQKFPVFLLFGFHYFNVQEKIRLNDAVYEIPTLPGSTLNVRDNFATKNNFYGLQLGARTSYDYYHFNLELTAEVGLGINAQKLRINGQTNVNNNIVIQNTGLFAEPSNIGTFSKNQFATLSQLEAKLGYKLNSNLSTFIAYNFLYINKVIRPGDQIDRNINQSQNILIGGTGTLTGPASPSPQFHNSSMWIQGLSLGIEFA